MPNFFNFYKKIEKKNESRILD
ncbi:hypothetical protein c7_R1242 [Megavirus courdo7]|uniref:Uncharacterized protein n=1 Tax=Megavirus courdo7 TaxID=1128135 RepID=H2ECG6_9VIRU|nr:hypothetical protein c7_R1242 [Megavirus courdo7]